MPKNAFHFRQEQEVESDDESNISVASTMSKLHARIDDLEADPVVGVPVEGNM